MADEKIAIVKIPEKINGMEVESNEVHPIVMVNGLKMLFEHYCRVVAKMAKDEVGDNERLQEQWIDRITKQYLGDNPGDLQIDVNQLN